MVFMISCVKAGRAVVKIVTLVAHKSGAYNWVYSTTVTPILIMEENPVTAVVSINSLTCASLLTQHNSM